MGIQLIAYLSGGYEIEENYVGILTAYRYLLIGRTWTKRLNLEVRLRGETCVRKLRPATCQINQTSSERMHSLFLQPWSESSSDNWVVWIKRSEIPLLLFIEENARGEREQNTLSLISSNEKSSIKKILIQASLNNHACVFKHRKLIKILEKKINNAKKKRIAYYCNI